MAKTVESRGGMKAHNPWTELLICLNCGQSGVAHLSQPEGRAYDVIVEVVPTHFKIVHLEFGDTFYCKACDRPADTKHLENEKQEVKPAFLNP